MCCIIIITGEEKMRQDVEVWFVKFRENGHGSLINWWCISLPSESLTITNPQTYFWLVLAIFRSFLIWFFGHCSLMSKLSHWHQTRIIFSLIFLHKVFWQICSTLGQLFKEFYVIPSSSLQIVFVSHPLRELWNIALHPSYVILSSPILLKAKTDSNEHNNINKICFDMLAEDHGTPILSLILNLGR